MSFTSRIHFVVFVIFGLIGELVFLDDLAHEGAQAADTFAQQEIFLPASVPEKSRLHPISILPVTVEGKIVGRVAIYDDSTTQRSADYLELYNNTGNLVAVSWFDSSGIERMAVDRGLLEGRDELKGIFVVVLDGEPV
jgi:hypothetical protein